MKSLEDIIRKPELVFVTMTSFFGLLSALLMPVLAVPDENQHFQISYAMFSAGKRAPEDIVKNEAMILSAVQDGGYKAFYTQETSVAHDGIAINTGSLVFDGKTRASTLDLMHLPQALGVLIGRLIYPSIGVMVLAGRLVTLALYVTALYFIIKNLRHGKWVFVFIASLPIMIQQAASVSYDPINTLAIFAWLAFIINIATQPARPTRAQVVIGVLLIVFLLLSKSNNALLLALLFAIPVQKFTVTNGFIRLRSSKYWSFIKYGAAAAFILVTCTIVYAMSVKLLAGQEFHPRRLWDVLLNTYIWGDLALIDVTTIGVIGQFSNFYYHIPVWAIIITFVVLIIVMLYEKLPDISRRFAFIASCLFFGSVLLISIGMYYGWAMRLERLGPGAEVTDGIQGRYFTPLLLLLFPVFAYFQRHIKVVTSNKSFVPFISTSTSILLLIFYVAQTWHFFWQ